MAIYTISYKDMFRRHTERLVGLLVDHTGLSASQVCDGLLGQSNYASRASKSNLSSRGHDRFLQNVSVGWPDDLDWPADIPRPPVELAPLSDFSIEARRNWQERLEQVRADQRVPQTHTIQEPQND